MPLPRLHPRLVAVALVLASGTVLAAGPEAQMALGKQLFTKVTPACALCHTLRDAGAEGAVGPVLDELRPDAQRVTAALRHGIGSMPSFQGVLTEAEIAALALYVSRASRGNP